MPPLSAYFSLVKQGEGESQPNGNTSVLAAADAQAAAAVIEGGGAWGKLRWIKNCINKYVNGRMSQEEMLSTNRATLRALAREQHQARLLRRQNGRQSSLNLPHFH